MEFTKDILFNNELKENQETKITYSGDLYRQNSESVTMVYGFGENWDYTTEQTMTKTDSGFITSVKIKDSFDTFHFCFRNSNYIWDNNNNSNYISTIQPNISTEISTDEQSSKSDNDLILELLDNLLDENINTVQTDSSEKQQILEDILSETNSSTSETSNTTIEKAEPIWFEKFDMDQLVEEILNPVINCQYSESKETGSTIESEIASTIEETTYSTSYQDDLSALKEDLDSKFAALFENSTDEESSSSTSNVQFTNIQVVEEEKESEEISSNQLLPMEEDQFLVSPRKLSKFYLLRKKIKLALYKAVVAIPKMLTGEFDSSK